MALRPARRNVQLAAWAKAARTVIARDASMRRRVVSMIDQMPGVAFVAGAALVLGMLRAGGLLARLRENRGAAELAAILFGSGFVILVIFAVRRRQTNVWTTAAQVLAAIVASNLFALTLVWPFLPSGLPMSLASTAWSGLANGVAGAFVGIPLGAAGLWLSRHWGTDSGVTERRARSGLRRTGQPDPIATEHANDQSSSRERDVTKRASEPSGP
jgi:hypothetical protein